LSNSKASYIIAKYYYVGLPANSQLSGSINISTPLYRSLSGNNPITIKTLQYKDWKLLKVTYMNITQTFTEIKLTLNVLADNTNIG
jgi:hypothetical protein